MSYSIVNLGFALRDHLGSYHQEVRSVLAPLPADRKISSIARRIFICLVIPIACPLFIGTSLIGTVLLRSINHITPKSPFELGRELKTVVDQLRLSAHETWQDDAIALVRQARNDQASSELERLQGAGILGATESSKLDVAIQEVGGGFWRSSPVMKSILGQALEIKSIFSQTHDVFIHGQASSYLSFSYLLKELHRAHRPDLNLRHYKFLRGPASIIEQSFSESTGKRVSSFFGGADTAETYRSKLNVYDHCLKTREDLISADGYFYNSSPAESALYFLSINFNMLHSTAILKKIMTVSLLHFYPKIKSEDLDQAVATMTDLSVNHASCGNLFVICTPKDQRRRFQYRAHPGGTACNCHPKEEDEAILESLQAGNLEISAKCKGELGIPVVPQFRLHAPTLTPEEKDRTHRSFLLTPLPKSYKKALKLKIKTLVGSLQKKALLAHA